jgi:hypothetical protein
MPVNPFTDPEFINPPNTKRIEKIYVGLSVDAQGFNGICAAIMPGIGATQMITASEKVLAFFKEQAGWVEQRTGTKVHFFEFVRGAELEADDAG